MVDLTITDIYLITYSDTILKRMDAHPSPCLKPFPTLKPSVTISPSLTC